MRHDVTMPATTNLTTQLPGVDLSVARLGLGANVFGWTADEASSFAVLDRFTEAGGTMIDTADSYSHWVPGNSGGESETIIGRWLARSGRRNEVIIATKVGKSPTAPGLSRANITASIDGSLRRLGVEAIDLYYAHEDDESVPMEEFLATFDGLVRAGKVRAIGASNFTAERLAEAMQVSKREGLTPFVALQQHYNLMERPAYEGPLQQVAQTHNLLTFPYFGLAKGFLTGKYRGTKAQELTGPRADASRAYQSPKGDRVLAALDTIAAAHGCSPGCIALAWLAQQPTVAAPLASARSVHQLDELLPVLSLTLTGDEIALLDHASGDQL